MQRFLYLVEGNTNPVPWTIQDDAGASVDLSGFATVKALVRLDTGATLSVTCSVVSASAGTITIPFSASDLVRGRHELSFELETAGGLKQYQPEQYTVGLEVRRNIEVT